MFCRMICRGFAPRLFKPAPSFGADSRAQRRKNILDASPYRVETPLPALLDQAVKA